MCIATQPCMSRHFAALLCIYIYISIHTYICMYIRIHISIYMYIDRYVHIYMCVPSSALAMHRVEGFGCTAAMCIATHPCMSGHLALTSAPLPRAQICITLYVYMYTYVYIYIHTRIYMYVYVYTHIYVYIILIYRHVYVYIYASPRSRACRGISLSRLRLCRGARSNRHGRSERRTQALEFGL